MLNNHHTGVVIKLNGTLLVTEGEIQEMCVSVNEERERSIDLSFLILPISNTSGMIM